MDMHACTKNEHIALLNTYFSTCARRRYQVGRQEPELIIMRQKRLYSPLLPCIEGGGAGPWAIHLNLSVSDECSNIDWLPQFLQARQRATGGGGEDEFYVSCAMIVKIVFIRWIGVIGMTIGLLLTSVFRIRNILRRIRILGSVNWIAESWSCSFLSGFQDGNLKLVFLHITY